MSNELRMSFGEWLSKMAESDMPAAGRIIAIYAAVFDITGNDQLSALSGIHGRTLDKWKRKLVSEGWVIIGRREGGRGHGIHVYPAFRETPVTFTDIRPKKGGKYYPRNFEQTPVEIAGDTDPETPAENAPVCETPAEITPVISAPVSGSDNNHARAECNNNYNNLPIENTTTGASGERGVGREAEAKATRLKPDWYLPEPWGVWALENFHITRDQIYAEAESFADYWHGKSGKDARKTNWEATWRNWVRNSRAKYRRRKINKSIAPDLLGAPDSVRSAIEENEAFAAAQGWVVPNQGVTRE